MEAESLLAHVLVELAVIIACARLGGLLFRRLGQPAVCGEVAAGLILGPSVLGGLFPDLAASVFRKDTEEAFTVMSQLGLILLLFLIGLNFDFRQLKGHIGKPVAISVVGIALPFALGCGVGWMMHSHVAPDVPATTFSLFVALTLSITAMPVLGRILIEFGLHKTPLGVLTMTSAAVDDAIGWTLLAVIIGIATSDGDVARPFIMAGETVCYVLFLFVVARPYLTRWARAAVGSERGLGQGTLTIVLILLFISALITSKIGIFAVFGAFTFGAILSGEAEFRDAILARLNDFVTVFFLPIFFTYTGLRTDIGSLGSVTLWALCAFVIVVGVIGKLGGCAAAARAVGLPWRDAAMVGVLMNTRALMALIVVNVGLDAGILNSTAFVMLVLMAIVTTYMTAPLLKLLLSGASKDSLAHAPDPIDPSLAFGSEAITGIAQGAKPTPAIM